MLTWRMAKFAEEIAIFTPFIQGLDKLTNAWLLLECVTNYLITDVLTMILLYTVQIYTYV